MCLTGWITWKSEQSVGGEQTCVVHMRLKEALPWKHLLQGSVQPALPKALPGLKTLNSLPKKPHR